MASAEARPVPHVMSEINVTPMVTDARLLLSSWSWPLSHGGWAIDCRQTQAKSLTRTGAAHGHGQNNARHICTNTEIPDR